MTVRRRTPIEAWQAPELRCWPCSDCITTPNERWHAFPFSFTRDSINCQKQDVDASDESSKISASALWYGPRGEGCAAAAAVMHACPRPAINSAHDGVYTEADLSSDIVTLSPAAAAAIVSPLNKEKKGLHSSSNFTLSLGVFVCRGSSRFSVAAWKKQLFLYGCGSTLCCRMINEGDAMEPGCSWNTHTHTRTQMFCQGGGPEHCMQHLLLSAAGVKNIDGYQCSNQLQWKLCVINRLLILSNIQTPLLNKSACIWIQTTCFFSTDFFFLIREKSKKNPCSKCINLSGSWH